MAAANNDSSKRAGEFAESSAAKKPNTATGIVTVKATVRGQLREHFFRTEDTNLIKSELIEGKLRSMFNVTGGWFLDKDNFTDCHCKVGKPTIS